MFKLIFSQVQDRKQRILVYYSRVFNRIERNYYVAWQKLLAVESLKPFHHYLYGRKFHEDISLHWLIISFKALEGTLIGTFAVI